MDTARLFVSIDIPAKQQRILSRYATDIGLTPEIIRTVPAEQMHLTLKFIGATKISDIPQIISALEDITIETEPVEITTSKLIIMPRRKPSVVAAGVIATSELSTLQYAVEHALVETGVAGAELRPYRPHITLCRITRGATLHEDEIVSIEARSCDLVWDATELSLIESQLTAAGPRYTTLQTFPIS